MKIYLLLPLAFFNQIYFFGLELIFKNNQVQICLFILRFRFYKRLHLSLQIVLLPKL